MFHKVLVLIDNIVGNGYQQKYESAAKKVLIVMMIITNYETNSDISSIEIIINTKAENVPRLWLLILFRLRRIFLFLICTFHFLSLPSLTTYD
jgi:hypothetical protein